MSISVRGRTLVIVFEWLGQQTRYTERQIFAGRTSLFRLYRIAVRNEKNEKETLSSIPLLSYALNIAIEFSIMTSSRVSAIIKLSLVGMGCDALYRWTH